MNKKMFRILAVFCIIAFFFVFGKTETQDTKSSTAISHTIGNRMEKMHLAEAVPDVKEAGTAARLLKLNALRKDTKTAARSILAALFVVLYAGILTDTGKRLHTFLSVSMTFLTYFILQLRILHQMDGKKRVNLFCTR